MAKSNLTDKKMITAEDLFFKEPLYNFIEYKEDDFKEIFNLIFFSGKIDNFCPKCGKESILKATPAYFKANKQESSWS